MGNTLRTWIGTGLALAGIAGCSSQGLSARESGMQTYSEVVYPASPQPAATRGVASGEDPHAMQIPAVAVPTTGPVRLELPARVSVVQLGEITPPESMLSSLRDHPELFAKVSAQTGLSVAADKENPHERLDQMRAMARNLGSQYLLVFGGNIDSGRQQTGLAIFDLTIIGIYIVPSTGVAVSGKAAGSLVDVESGRVLMNFSADTKGHGMAAPAFAENAETAAVDQAKDELVTRLTKDVVTQMGGQVKTPVAMTR
jgi:hypothetical protein